MEDFRTLMMFEFSLIMHSEFKKQSNMNKKKNYWTAAYDPTSTLCPNGRARTKGMYPYRH